MTTIFLKSPGGSGTRYLYSCFGKENLCGRRSWFNPHQRFNDQLPKDAQVFYVIAHPLNILLSFEKEGFFADPNYRMIENIQGDKNSWMLYGVNSLQKYADSGVNLFDFKGHYLDNWKNYPYMTTLIYEKLETDIHKIPLTQIESKPFVQRRSDYTKSDSELISKLKEIHKEDIEHFNKLL